MVDKWLSLREEWKNYVLLILFDVTFIYSHNCSRYSNFCVIIVNAPHGKRKIFMTKSDLKSYILLLGKNQRPIFKYFLSIVFTYGSNKWMTFTLHTNSNISTEH